MPTAGVPGRERARRSAVADAQAGRGRAGGDHLGRGHVPGAGLGGRRRRRVVTVRGFEPRRERLGRRERGGRAGLGGRRGRVGQRRQVRRTSRPGRGGLRCRSVAVPVGAESRFERPEAIGLDAGSRRGGDDGRGDVVLAAQGDARRGRGRVRLRGFRSAATPGSARAGGVSRAGRRRPVFNSSRSPGRTATSGAAAVFGPTSLASASARPPGGRSQRDSDAPTGEPPARVEVGLIGRGEHLDLADAVVGLGLILGVDRQHQDGHRAAVKRQAEVGDDREDQALPQRAPRPPARPGQQGEHHGDRGERRPGAEVGPEQVEEAFQVQAGHRVAP